MCSGEGIQTSLWTGCPIRILKAHRSYAAPLERFAGLRVLLRPHAPRHPPRTLSRLWSPLLEVAHRENSVFFACLCFSSLALGKIEEITFHYVFKIQLFTYKV